MLWIQEKEQIWLRVNVVSISPNGDTITYKIPQTQQTATVSKVLTHPVDPTHLLNLENLCDMNNLHEAPLLDLLRRRFGNEEIYTFTGVVLISLNPYKSISGLYENPLSFFDTSDKQGLSATPHVYSIANQALKSLISSENLKNSEKPVSPKATNNQSIIVSGESGAGKTEASKHVMNFLIAANQFIQHDSISNRHASAKISLLASKHEISDAFTTHLTAVLTQSSLIFEAFGNAKTVRNDNSSRFGKYIKLLYSAENNILTSAVTETFLLEKSRLVSVNANERNYHIFYQLIRGLATVNPALCSELHLSGGVDVFSILTAGDCTVITTCDQDVDEFKHTQTALETVNCSAEEISGIYSLLCAILHLGNLQFTPTPISSEDTTEVISVSSPSMPLGLLSTLIGVSPERLTQCLTTQQLRIAKRSSIKIKILSLEETRNNNQALCKYIYSKLFAWLVAKINVSHSATTGTAGNAAGAAVSEVQRESKFIGILDIFGFEILTTNSFEQLCINYTNERLQQQFNEHVFVTEQFLYEQEGLNFSSISFQDNQHVIDLIAKKTTGLLSILEEHGMMNRKPDDIALLNNYHAIHIPTNNTSNSNNTINNISNNVVAYGKSRFGNTSFVVKHFAGDVSYLIEGFLIKNNDSLQEDLTELLLCSQNVLLRNIIAVSSNGTVDGMEGAGYLQSYAGLASGGNNTVNNNNNNSNNSGNAAVVGGASSKKLAASVTVSFQFRSQLDVLMSALRSTTPHYVKCIKPNTTKQRDVCDSGIVMQQLRYSGVLEVVRIRREGYPVRVSFQDFYRSYAILCSHLKNVVSATLCSVAQAKEYSVYITAEVLRSESYQIGKNYVFMRDGTLQLMQIAIDNYLAKRATTIQTMYRRVYYRAKYLSTMIKVIRTQSVLRSFLEKVKYNRKIHAIKKIQYFFAGRRIRMAFVVKYKAIQLHRLQMASATHLQRNYRGYKDRIKVKNYRVYLATIRLQRIFRGHCGRKIATTQRRLRAVIRIQSIVRMRKSYNVLKKIKHTVTIIAKMVRKLQAVRKYKQYRTAVLKIQHYVRINRNQALLRMRIISLHKMLVEGGEKNWQAVSQHLKAYPNDRFVLNKYNNYCTIIQSAVLGCNIVVLSNLGVTYSDLFVQDARGCNAIHYLCMTENITQQHNTLLLLCRVLNTYQFVGTKSDLQGFDEEDDHHHTTTSESAAGHTASSAANNNFKTMFAPGNTTTILKSGWLKKKRGGFMWQKRWAILTEDYMVYFKDPNNLTMPKFAIPLEGCTINRVAGSKEPILEITSPHMGEKKGLFSTSNKKTMCFTAESEKDLQEWLVPLKAVAGVETFRTQPVHYIATELRVLWLNQVNHSGDTVLHTLAKHAHNYADKDILAQLTAWCISAGCDVHALNAHGQTALHVAVLHTPVREFVQCLLQRGADVSSVRDNNNKTVSELAVQYKKSNALEATDMAVFDLITQFGSNMSIRSISGQSSAPISPDPKRLQSTATPTKQLLNNTLTAGGLDGPAKLKGYSYVSFYLRDSIGSNFSRAVHPSITLSVQNHQRQLIEQVREILQPLKHTENGACIHWHALYHLQTPIETIQSGSFVLIEFKSNTTSPNHSPAHSPSTATVATESPNNIYWGHFPIDLDRIDSAENQSIVLHSYPVNLDASNGSGAGSVTFDVIVSRKPNEVDVAMLLK